jgi:hypothetical protein
MDSNKFLTVLYMQEVEPASCKSLVPYRPPDDSEIARMPRVPKIGEYRFAHTLALVLGSGNSSDFQASPNPVGVNLMVCRQWRFFNGVFQNAESIVWPGAMMGSDVLVYDPNWPWMRLVIPRPTATSVRMLDETGQKKIGEEDLTAKIDRMIRNGHEVLGKYVWKPGDFWIEMRALQDDIQDVRSDLQKSYSDRFEGQRRSHEETRAWRVRNQPWAFDASERRAAERFYGMAEGFLDRPSLPTVDAMVRKLEKAVEGIAEVIEAEVTPPTVRAFQNMVEETVERQTGSTGIVLGGVDPASGPDVTARVTIDTDTGNVIDVEFEDVP